MRGNWKEGMWDENGNSASCNCSLGTVEWDLDVCGMGLGCGVGLEWIGIEMFTNASSQPACRTRLKACEMNLWSPLMATTWKVHTCSEPTFNQCILTKCPNRVHLGKSQSFNISKRIFSINNDPIASQFVQVLDQGTKHSLQSKVLWRLNKVSLNWKGKNKVPGRLRICFHLAPQQVQHPLREGNTCQWRLFTKPPPS